MAFILLIKRPDDRVVTLSEDVYETRKDATDALSGLTADPSFEHWDAEVFVVDIDKATPVLLVRPAAAQEDISEPVDLAEAPADVAFTYAGSDAGGPEEATESLVVEDDVAVEAEEAEASEEGVAVAGDADLSAALSELGLGDEPEVQDEEPVSEETEPDALRAAIARTTEQMAASGIVPPESVGPEEAAGAEDAVEAVEDAPEAELTEGASPAEEDAESNLDAAAWPWAADADGTPENPEAFSLSALEEPGADEGSLVKSSGDEDSTGIARPVIMGDYDDVPPTEPMSVSESPADETDEVRSDELAAALAAAVAEAGTVDEQQAIAGDADPAEAAEPEKASGDELSCDDCVYFQTCPNKEDREPASCGSFQWK